MTRGVDDAHHPGRQVTSESWKGLDAPDQHFATVEAVSPNVVRGETVSYSGAAYSAGPFKSPSRAGRAARALEHRIVTKGDSPRHRTNTIYKGA